MTKKKNKKCDKQKIFFAVKIIFLVLLILAIALYLNRTTRTEIEFGDDISKMIIRNPVVADQFYPGSNASLNAVIDEYFKNAQEKNLSNVKAIIVPHAGYIYSGLVAAEGFAQLDEKYDKVFIIATNHNSDARYSGISIANFTHYSTPLGLVKVSSAARKLLKENPDIFLTNLNAHSTHIIEVEIPFLQKKLDDFEIIPMVTSFLSDEEIDRAAKIIEKYIDEKTLLVISTDLSHYYPYETALSKDKPCIEYFANLDYENAKNCEACGLYAVLILMKIAEDKEWIGKVIDYKNSGDVAVGDKSKVVGYTAIAFYSEEDELIIVNSEEQRFLTSLARATLENYLKDGTVPSVNEDALTETLTKKSGCFVTLKKNDMLRGCIGHIIPQKKLYECVIENAISAALHDSRFPAVQYSELKDINVEVSVLTEPVPLEFTSGDDLLSKLIPRKHGVILKSGWHQSTYLPQVWDQITQKESFLSNLCTKGGMSADCWQKTSTEVFTYEAQHFSE